GGDLGQRLQRVGNELCGPRQVVVREHRVEDVVEDLVRVRVLALRGIEGGFGLLEGDPQRLRRIRGMRRYRGSERRGEYRKKEAAHRNERSATPAVTCRHTGNAP